MNVVHNMLVNAVDDKYICHLKHERTIYQNVVPITILAHLWTTYGTVDDGDITKNEERMKQQWNPPTTIETLYQQLETGRAYATKGGEAISERQLCRWGYDNILATGLFSRPCEKWRNMAMNKKSWNNFKAHFTQAEKDRSKTTATESGYTANATSKIEIENVVRETIQQELGNILCQELGQGAPPPPVFQPSELDATEEAPDTNAQANAVTTKDLKRVIEEVLNEYNPPARNTRNAKKRRKIKPAAQATVNRQDLTYCYTHGVNSNLWHNIKACTRRCAKHDETAT